MPADYTPVGFVNGSGGGTPINHDNLAVLEAGIVAASHTANTAIPSSAKAGAGAGGIATVDITGAVEQTPKSHVHTFEVQDGSGGTVYPVTRIVGSFGTGGVSVAGGVATFNAVPPDVSMKRPVQVSGADPVVVNSLSLTTLLTLPMVAGQAYDGDVSIWIKSSSLSRARFSILGPNGATPSTLFAQFFAPREFEADGVTPLQASAGGGLDVDLWRYTPITTPNNGPQRFGGFPPARNSAGNGGTTSGSAAITAGTAFFSAASDVGAVITGTGIPTGTTITAVADSTHATMSLTATATATTTVFTVNTLGWVCAKITDIYCALGAGGTPGNVTIGFAQAVATPTSTSATIGPSKMLWAAI